VCRDDATATDADANADAITGRDASHRCFRLESCS
jgi:hypothetical protein